MGKERSGGLTAFLGVAFFFSAAAAFFLAFASLFPCSARCVMRGWLVRTKVAHHFKQHIILGGAESGVHTCLMISSKETSILATPPSVAPIVNPPRARDASDIFFTEQSGPRVRVQIDGRVPISAEFCRAFPAICCLSWINHTLCGRACLR